ncbi:MAG: hypothetical protein FWE71_00270 [Nocardioidaceae bacterium]|nr:hypothetical protein [Nocardioidaceae bacterium]MCL2615083.1 hypothetical protein [Nocardioidaceae bacterium]
MLKKLLFIAVLGGIAVAVVKKLQAGSASAAGDGWQSSYDPTPAPSAPAQPAPTDAAPPAPEATSAPSDVPPPPVDIPPAKTDVDPLTDPLPEDQQG